MKSYIKRIVSPNHEKPQGSRDQRQHLKGTWNLSDLTTEMLKCNACFQKLFPSRYACMSWTSVQMRQEYLQFMELH